MEKLRGMRVLVVEDNPVNLLLASRVLERQGMQVTQAEDGQAAVEACRENRFDLLLMDLQMPVMDGVEAARRIRKREAEVGGHVPILAYTASTAPGEIGPMVGGDIDGYVTKPVGIASLLAAIARVLDRAHPAGGSA